MITSNSSTRLPKLPSDRLTLFGKLVRAGVIAELGPTSWAVWSMLALGHANDSGRCWPARTKVEGAVGLKRSAVARAISKLADKGWLDRLGRPQPGHTAEFRVVVPTSFFCRLQLPNQVHARGSDQINQDHEGGSVMHKSNHADGCVPFKQGQENGRLRPSGGTNGSTRVVPQQKEETEQQQQNKGSAAAGDFEYDRGAAAEHPVVAKVLDRLGIVDSSARGRIAGMDGIELVISDLASRAKSGNRPAGLLIGLVKSEAPALIEAARATAQRRLTTQRTSGGVPESQRVRAEQEALLGPLSGKELEMLRQRVIAGQREGRPRDAAGRLGVNHLMMRGMMAELLQEDRVDDKPDTIPGNG